jgi:3-hydroxybutyryl-CoA dehydrogenase
MGTGIASVCALKGFKTFVYDVNEQALSRSHAVIFRGYDNLAEKNKFTAEEKSIVEKRLNFASDISKLSECELVIEAAVENIDLKKIIYSQIEEVVTADAVIATNT